MAKKVSAVRIDMTSVLAECAYAVGRGIERGSQGASQPITLGTGAGAFWVARYRKTIAKALRRQSADWVRDRRMVLPMADLLGVEAVTRARAANRTEISVADARGASRTVEGDPRCRAAKAGSGGYCEI